MTKEFENSDVEIDNKFPHNRGVSDRDRFLDRTQMIAHIGKGVREHLGNLLMVHRHLCKQSELPRAVKVSIRTPFYFYYGGYDSGDKTDILIST